MANFKIADEITRGHEEGHSYHPSDEGGETWNGIARRYHRDWAGWSLLDRIDDKKNISKEMRKELETAEHIFYLRKFWQPIKGDLIPDQDIANILYDIAVNFGTRRASRYLQRALNVMNRRGNDYNDLLVDGRIGRGTLNALNAYLSKRSKYALIDAMATFAKHYWLTKAEKNETQEDFVNGIFNRWILNAKQLAKNYFEGGKNV
ncbi:MAG: glycoside hydrolase family 108 protein [Arenicella sp.]